MARRWTVVSAAFLVGVLGAEIPAQSVPPAPLRAILVRAAAYVERFERKFALVVAEEDYRQQIGTGPWQMLPPERVRHTRAEVVFLWMPDEHLWLAARNVLAVNGSAVPESTRRVEDALTDRSGRRERLKRIRADSFRYNLGEIYRDINDATFALQFLDTRLQGRFRWELEARETGSSDVARIAFTERARPTLIRRENKVDLPATGKVWIESGSGVIRRTRLAVADPERRTRATIDVEFTDVPNADVLVPVAMDESYTQQLLEPARGFLWRPVTETILGRATYSNFRRFETSGRLIVPE